jgi:hypothetical protein
LKVCLFAIILQLACLSLPQRIQQKEIKFASLMDATATVLCRSKPIYFLQGAKVYVYQLSKRFSGLI